eukprot:TRINITY_DN45822_c0_g1_i1.p1 TRINITY_DN45822_c0_g1~~TRINITY_DN45822_c0_g1_i1.p1  ORF type:complete len:170 (+),score=10.62 TRINITY_DN45822_c0_g1_i1:76-585(+)
MAEDLLSVDRAGGSWKAELVFRMKLFLQASNTPIPAEQLRTWDLSAATEVPQLRAQVSVGDSSRLISSLADFQALKGQKGVPTMLASADFGVKPDSEFKDKLTASCAAFANTLKISEPLYHFTSCSQLISSFYPHGVLTSRSVDLIAGGPGFYLTDVPVVGAGTACTCV